ncbi:P-II family nitrogen regulator [Phycisphaera mikurensis]|uniref:Nitrogen regulatory protein P-II n=1 Tax=Phycisphaera mikurensis (strain NBRC 102666 / KCTC 22515 / FYK2301M01) TaxID=1142394 RepID=I0IC37_PHYMF|nr:hypothetical protein [Phycisphaera mikurensis]MBB6441953.1 nitrogen regulatory protein PII [Phycisphaera mikurensis]BAM02825.1 hypothetical protein PSMK_06660 [Phycisphaera mikurensis NBRC 102666]
MLYPATKVTLIAEHFLVERVCALIEACGGHGYTLTPVGGKGLHHLHATSDRATLVEGFDHQQVEVITTDRAKAERIAERALKELFTNHSGVVYLESIEVCRRERF